MPTHTCTFLSHLHAMHACIHTHIFAYIHTHTHIRTLFLAHMHAMYTCICAYMHTLQVPMHEEGIHLMDCSIVVQVCMYTYMHTTLLYKEIMYIYI